MTKNANTLVVDCAPDAGAMRSDQTKLRQSLFNLLSNAAKFTEQGRITLGPPNSPGPVPTWWSSRSRIPGLA